METYLKCLQFDFIAILLNETLDEPTQTNLPAAWECFIENPETINVLFFSVNMLLNNLQLMTTNKMNIQMIDRVKKMVVLSLRCLIEFANVRLTIFQNKQTKGVFVVNFVTNLVDSFGNMSQNQGTKLSLILHHPKIFRELLKMIHKFQFNFGVRSVVSSDLEGLSDQYFQGLFNLTVEAFRFNGPTKKVVILELMTYMNNIWQRFNFETIQLKLESQQRVE